MMRKFNRHMQTEMTSRDRARALSKMSAVDYRLQRKVSMFAKEAERAGNNADFLWRLIKSQYSVQAKVIINGDGAPEEHF